jgi:hypothetical protein
MSPRTCRNDSTFPLCVCDVLGVKKRLNDLGVTVGFALGFAGRVGGEERILAALSRLEGSSRLDDGGEFMTVKRASVRAAMTDHELYEV